MLVAAHQIEAVTFASAPHQIFVPVREAAEALGWKMEYDPLVELVTLQGKCLRPTLPRLSSGVWLISLAELASLGADARGGQVSSGTKSFSAIVREKRVSVDLKAQRLKAWQGSRLVYDWPVSSGREGKESPNGDFRAQEKEPMHISKLYGSPMPFSVHVVGNIYIHGSDRFSSGPGTHGCIRLPMMQTRNIAQEFYGWIDSGTPVSIRGAFVFQKQAPKG